MITVTRWIAYEDITPGMRVSIGGLGGFFSRGMRWVDYLSEWDEAAHPYAEALRAAVLARQLHYTGRQHQQSEDGVPVFSDGTIGRFSARAWGDLMAAVWAEHNDTDHSYAEYYW